MKLADLPPSDQRAIRRGAVDVRPAGLRRRTRPPAVAASTGRSDPSHQCVPCGATFGSYPRAERHVDREHGHGRIACVL